MKRQLYMFAVALCSVLPAVAGVENNNNENQEEWHNGEAVPLQQVVVTGTRTVKTLKDVPVQTRVITADDIKKMDATNIQEVLMQELPGVEFSFAMSKQTHLNFSGFGGHSILFLVDGERLAGETLDDVDFSRLVMANVERIEIIKGAASALYGSNASGGVINIITKSPEKDWTLNVNGRVRVGKRAENRYGLNNLLNGKKVQNVLAYVGTNTDSYNVTNSPAVPAYSVVSTFYGEKSQNINDKFTWMPTDGLKFVFRGGYYFREKQTSTATLPDHYRDLTLGVRGFWDITKKDNLELSYNFDQYDKAQHSTISNLCLRIYSNVQNNVRTLYNHTFSKGNVLTVGGDYMRDYLLNSKTVDGVYTQHTADFFAQFDWNVTDALEILAAARYDYLSEGNRHRVSPKLNVRYRVNDDLTLRAGYGMGFRSPTLKERYYIFDMAGIWDIVGSNVIGYTLQPEVSHNINMSADYMRNGYNLTASAYYSNIRNRITAGSPHLAEDFPGDVSMLSTGKWLPYVNIEKYNTYGFDITAQKHWGNGIGAKVAYAYVHEELPKDADGMTINNQYQPARPHSFTMRVDWDRQLVKNYGFNVALSGRFLSAVDNVEFYDYDKLLRHNVHYGAYTLWKLQVTQRIYEAFNFTMTFDNLFDYNPTNHYLNAPFTDGLTFMLGLSVDIDKLF